MEMPEELAGPRGPGSGERDGEVKYRAITLEENLNRQIDRIAFLRSAGYEWGEAVYQLRDMVVGLEDDEFYDGIPDRVRSDLEEREADEEEWEAVRERFAEHGWESHSVDAVEGPDGRPVFMPSHADLSKALRIVMRLLARRGIVWKRKTRTRFGPFGEVEKEGS